jgi:aminobenzoyl-glutamate utilization protein A
MDTETRYGLPPEAQVDQAFARAREEGGAAAFLAAMEGGFTGVVGTLDTGKPGPTVGLRVDMDALPILEAASAEHVPAQEGFRSRHEGVMHACGHDAHTAIGLSLAEIMVQQRAHLRGRIKFIFQPAEEGGRGALPMTNAGVVDDVDYFIAIHVGTGIPSGVLRPAVTGHLASTKMDVVFRGQAAHAGGRPDEGRNALVAAAHAVLGLYGIARHHQGRSRVNVGVLKAGSGRNVIPDEASLLIECRGETEEILQYMENRCRAVLAGAAAAEEVSHEIKLMGKTTTATSDTALSEIVCDAASAVANLEIIAPPHITGGSEDATYFMRRVQERGGQAIYCVIGTDLPSGHHTPTFDIQERDLPAGIHALALALARLTEEPALS